MIRTRLLLSLRLTPPLAAPVLLAGCSGLVVGEAFRVELDTRRVDYPLEDGGADDEGEEGVWRMGARQVLWFVPETTYAETRSVVRTELDGDETRRTLTLRVVDYAGGSVWTSTDEGPWTRTLLAAEEYERETEERRARTDLVDLYLRSPRVRALQDFEYWYADDLLGDGRESSLAGGKVYRLGVEPGVLWEVTVRESLAEELPGWLPGRLIHAVMGVRVDDARRLAASLRGFPVRFRAGVVPEETRTVVTVSVISMRRAALPRRIFEPGRRDRERYRRLEERLRDPREALETLEKGLPEGLSVVHVIALFEPRLETADFDRVEDLSRRSDDFLLKVELLRLLLRTDRDAAWERLRANLSGTDGLDALAAAEALVAEDDERSLDAVLLVLERRQTYTDLPPSSVVPWAVRHLRVLSGKSAAELASDLSEAWPPEPGAEAAGDPVGIELDYWLRWAEER